MLETFSIQQVSQRTNVSKHTLRFWERALNGVIVPLRTQGGQRRYTKYHLLIIAEIKKLKKNGLTLTDIKKRLDTNESQIDEKGRVDKIDILANQIAQVVKSSIYNFLADKDVKILD